MDKVTQNVRTVDYDHSEIHSGTLYRADYLYQNIADDKTARLHIVAGENKKAHVQIFVETEGKAYVKVYTHTTYTNIGTEIVAINQNTSSNNRPDAKTYYSPIVDVLGTQISTDLMGGGSSIQVESQSYGHHEIVLDHGDDLLVKVQNKSGDTKDINIKIIFYEE